jgi:putative ABC transport system ATP-binding protein
LFAKGIVPCTQKSRKLVILLFGQICRTAGSSVTFAVGQNVIPYARLRMNDLSRADPAPLLTVTGLAKRYGDTFVFSEVSLAMARGELVALLGESGVGKSTLLNCVAGLDTADAGSVTLAGRDVLGLSEPEAARLRREDLGFVFQAFHVLPHLNVADNVGLPLQLLGRPRGDRVERMLAAVGLGGLGERAPRQLSGGQLQRVAIARALVHEPALVLADEPTGNLDPRSAGLVMDVLVDAARRTGAGVLLVTHSPQAASRCDRVLELTAQGVRRPLPA